MLTRGKKLALLLLAWICLALGVLGLFLPVLQGVLFLLISLFLLSSEYVWAHRLLHRIRQRFPQLAGRLEVASRKAQAWMARIFQREHEPVQ